MSQQELFADADLAAETSSEGEEEEEEEKKEEEVKKEEKKEEKKARKNANRNSGKDDEALVPKDNSPYPSESLPEDPDPRMQLPDKRKDPNDPNEEDYRLKEPDPRKIPRCKELNIKYVWNQLRNNGLKKNQPGFVDYDEYMKTWISDEQVKEMTWKDLPGTKGYNKEVAEARKKIALENDELYRQADKHYKECYAKNKQAMAEHKEAFPNSHDRQEKISIEKKKRSVKRNRDLKIKRAERAAQELALISNKRCRLEGGDQELKFSVINMIQMDCDEFRFNLIKKVADKIDHLGITP